MAIIDPDQKSHVHDHTELLDPDQPGLRPYLRSWCNPRFLLGVVLAVVAVEAGMRVLETFTDNHATVPTLFLEHDQRFQQRDFDVIALGSSSMGAAWSAPEIHDAGFACATYSAWLASPTMVDIARHARESVLEREAPRQVVLGVTMREFNAGTPTFADPDLDDYLDGDDPFTEHLAILRIRNVVQDPDRFGNAVLGRGRDQTDQDGHHLPSIDQVIADETAAHRQQEADEMADYSLSADSVAALDELLVHLHDSGIDVVLVNLPVSPLFVDMAPNSDADYDRYLDAIVAVAARTDTSFFDGNEVPLDRDNDFADVNHLNRQGSQSFTTALVASGLLQPATSCASTTGSPP